MDIPNKEVRVGFFKSLLPNYLSRRSPKAKVNE